MTRSELVAAVQAHFSDFTDPFKTRIEAVIPSAVARFLAEAQWEFLDKYTTTTTSVSTSAAVGKYQVDLPDDFFKPIVVFTETREIEYRDRNEWARMQHAGSGSFIPQYYTVIGPEMILTHTPDSSTIEMVYTRKADNYGFDDLPSQYHWAVQMAAQLLLTPAYFTSGDQKFPNPELRQSSEDYERAIGKAKRFEVTIKGRVRELLPSAINRRRAAYT
jgi:hypothetical protein